MSYLRGPMRMCVDSTFGDMKKSIEFVHGEVNDLKEENQIRKEKQTFCIDLPIQTRIIRLCGVFNFWDL